MLGNKLHAIVAKEIVVNLVALAGFAPPTTVGAEENVSLNETQVVDGQLGDTVMLGDVLENLAGTLEVLNNVLQDAHTLNRHNF